MSDRSLSLPQMELLSITPNRQPQPASAGKRGPLVMCQKDGDATYGGFHILSIPIEIRHAVWRIILSDVNKSRKTDWFTKPRAEFLPLMLTCRQLYHELRDFRPQHLVPFTNFARFSCSLEDAITINKGNASKYRSMTIQFRLDASPQKYQCLEYILRTCKDALEELHLSFTGPDRYGTNTYLHGCAYARQLGRETKLPPEGQHAEEVLNILWAIFGMTKLRILVLSNLNFTLFPTIFKHKPQLEYLHVTADPRSAVHLFSSGSDGLGVFLNPSTNFGPPIKVLSISANSMLNAIALPSKCARTLEHLTWTIPDASLGSNLIGADLFSHTRQLIDCFALNPGKLKTLRICIQGAGLYRNATQYNELEAALTTNISLISSLREIEIHSQPRSLYLGDAILRALPPTIERFYTRDCLVRPREVYRFLSMRYLSNQPRPLQTGTLPYDEEDLSRWYPQQPLASPNHDCYPEYLDHSPDEEPIKMWLHPATLEPMYHPLAHPPYGYEIHRKVARQGPLGLYLDGIIGEDKNRTDYIPMRNGNLTFVAYDFENPEYRGPNGETITQMLLRLNGRLLDRAHNKHLSHVREGHCIKPNWGDGWPVPDEDEPWHASQHQSIQRHLRALYYAERRFPRNVKAALAELKASPLINDECYFGDIEMAHKMFLAERPARAEDLPQRRYPYFVDDFDGDCDGQCHWMCPEANVPSLVELDEARAAAIAESSCQ